MEDLLKPQYAAKLSCPDASQHTTTAQWMASLHKVMGGKEKADKFIRRPRGDKAAVGPITDSGRRADHHRRNADRHRVHQERGLLRQERRPAGLRAAWANSWATDKSIALGAKPPHPNAGKAFIDFFLGEEGLKIMADIGEFVTRKGIYPPLPDADKIQLGRDDRLWIKRALRRKNGRSIHERIFPPTDVQACHKRSRPSSVTASFSESAWQTNSGTLY